jgi:hypothetical protein
MLRKIIFAAAILTSSCFALSDKELDSIGARVWKNECGGTREGLTSWNSGEAFASLGIGHFIWYPKGASGPYEESFPGLVAFLNDNGVKVPAWLDEKTACPWRTKAEFEAASQSPKMKELRAMLAGSIREQSKFLARRMERAMPKLLAATANKSAVESRFKALLATGSGTYALIDYVNFKGEGTNPSERYKGEGWGLLQVLEGMESNTSKAFGSSAARVLTRRVENSDPARNEKKWLPGWLNRVRGY